MSKKIPEVAVEFQPDAIQIKNEKLPFLARYSVIFAFIFLTGVIIWAFVGQVDVIVQASGKIVSDTPNIVMKPYERVVIQSIDVKVGDVVKEGQTLITFDPTINKAESDRIQNEIEALKAQQERLSAEFYSTPYEIVAEDKANRFEKLQLASFNQRKEYYNERINYYTEALNQLDAQKKSREDNLKKQKERLASIIEIEKIYDDLYGKGAGTLRELLDNRVRRMEMEAGVDELENSILELKHQRESTDSAKKSFVQEWRNTISEELVKTSRELWSNEKQLEKSENLIQNIELKAPCDAVVHEIAAFSTGTGVREAEALITLIPLNGNLEVEAEVRPQDIGKVGRNAEVRIKLNAYPFQKYGTLDGKIRDISEDTIQLQQPKQTESGPLMSYYRAKISIDDGSTLDGVKESFRLIPGMEVQCEIKTGRRRIIEYLIYPLIKAFDETAREP